MERSININSDNLFRFSEKLSNLGKSTLPVVVRQTLNSAGFDLKQKTMPAEAYATFTIRQATFFKHTSHVEQATGFNLSDMHCDVGFTSENKYRSQAVSDLEVQEAGGDLLRSFIPMDTARVGGTNKGLVKAEFRLTAIQRVIIARNQRGKNKSEQFIKAAVLAGVGGFVLADDRKGDSILWRVDDLMRVSGNTRMKLTPIYDYTKGRSVRISQTAFMERATDKTAAKMDDFFIQNAEHQFEKALQ